MQKTKNQSFQKVNNSVLPHITFSSENDDTNRINLIERRYPLLVN